MAIIKKSKIIEKGIIDLKQEAYSPPQQKIVQEHPVKKEMIKELKTEEPPAHVMEEAYEKASQITAAAQLEAQELIENAQLEVETIMADAKKEGLEEGRREGEEHIAEYVAEALETLNSAIKERKKIIKDAEAELVRLSLKIAEQIVRSEISLHKDVVLNIVTEAINKIGDRENVIIKVNREDAEYIKQYKDRISGVVDGVKNLSILEDSQVEQGGCVVETHLGYVDARISTKLSLLEESLKRAESSV